MEFDYQYFFKAIIDLLSYIPMTLLLAMCAMILSILLGIIFNMLLKVNNIIITSIIKIYISFFRGTPLIVQLFILYFGLPQLYPPFKILTALIAGIIGLSLNNTAFVSEIIRGGLNGVSKIQLEAADSLNLSHYQKFKLVIYPQTIRIIFPSIVNNFIGLILATSLVFTIGISELMARSQAVTSFNFKYFEQYMAVAIVYWFMAIMIETIQHFIEKKYNIAYKTI